VADHAADEPAYGCVVFDVDGTLVDSNYHHALAWYRAFRAHDLVLPLWQIHRHMGMGGDKLVTEVAGEDVERRHGDSIRDGWKAHFDTLIGEVAPVAGAAELLRAVRSRGARVVLASSGKPDHVDHFLDLLGARDVADAWTSSADVEETKPDPELLQVALDKVQARHALTVGDSTWDCVAAERLGLPAVAVLTGGFSTEELQAAGAAEVFESLSALGEHLDRALAG
jgi:phosphoglycolate phosphatase-like HAD superfamily hydrolase